MNRDYAYAKALLNIAEVITWLGIIVIAIMAMAAGLSPAGWRAALMLFAPTLIAAGVILLAVEIAWAQIHTAENTSATARDMAILLKVMKAAHPPAASNAAPATPPYKIRAYNEGT